MSAFRSELSLRLAAGALAALLGACATRDVPSRYPESSPASPAAATPTRPVVAAALASDPTPNWRGLSGDKDAAAPQHDHGGHHGH
jgi:hypothetical protein